MIRKIGLAIGLFLLGIVWFSQANAFVVDSISYRIYYNIDRHQYEVGVTEHDTYSNHEMYVGDVVIPEVVN